MIKKTTLLEVAIAIAAIGGCLRAFDPGIHAFRPTIKVGLLHSQTGTMAISERAVLDATLLAIDEINEAGGLLGSRLEPVVLDGRSDWPTFARGAES